ncbi:MAG TPA: tetratricopeptide repeat protein, partial [Armatimonadetes bacterium]|nr:tetratricopeptide repeat protein [Armatimonadota bacterium]
AQKKFFDAIRVYRKIVDGCPGSDLVDDAQMAVAECYQELSALAKQLREVYLPEREREAIEVWEHAGGKGLPDPKELLERAVTEFSKLVEEFIGSDLRDDAMERIVKCYRDAGDVKGEMMASLRFLAEFPTSDRADRVAKAVQEMLKESGGPICIKPRCLVKAFEPIIWAGPANDLYDDALYYAACGRLALGHFDQARAYLRKLAKGWSDSPLRAYAQFLLARTEEISGKPEEAARNYKLLAEAFPHSGLADGAQVALQGESIDVNRYGSYPHFREAIERVKPFGADITRAGPIVVVMPVVYSPFLRSYNLPNLLESAAEEVAKAFGLEAPDRLMAMAVDPLEEEPKVGSLMVVPGKVAKVEPPLFEEAFKPLAMLYAKERTPDLLAVAMPSFPEAFSEFAATYLRYNLVREVRELIGSPQAERAAAPFNLVRRKRDEARRALHEAVRKGVGLGQMDATAGCGLLFALIERAGGYKENALNWEAVLKLMEVARKVPEEFYKGKGEEVALAALAACIGEDIGTDGAKFLRDLGLKVDPKLVESIRQSLFTQRASG